MFRNYKNKIKPPNPLVRGNTEYRKPPPDKEGVGGG